MTEPEITKIINSLKTTIHEIVVPSITEQLRHDLRNMVATEVAFVVQKELAHNLREYLRDCIEHKLAVSVTVKES